MTLSDDLNFAEQAADLDAGASPYPVIFGISLTPQIIGIGVGVTGVLAALYMLLNMVMPAWDAYQQKQTQSNDLEGQITQKKVSVKKLSTVTEELSEAKKQKQEVLSLFADEKTLGTLLLDLNRLVEAGNAQLPPNAVRAKLQKFVPVIQKPEPVIDGSLGTGVDGKLKRTSMTVEIVGTYEQTQSIIRNIERLQPLLIVKEYQSALAGTQATDTSGKPIRRVGPEPITTSFQIQALMPLTPQEIAALTPKETPKK